MQPQTYNTGHGGSDAGEPKVSAHSASSNELPAPTPGNLQPGSPMPLPTSVNPPSSNPTPTGNTAEHWVSEVEQLFVRTTQNPRQRADELNELRRRYQHEVLGIMPKGREV